MILGTAVKELSMTLNVKLENTNILENKRPINPNRLEHVIKGVVRGVFTGKLTVFRGKQTK